MLEEQRHYRVQSRSPGIKVTREKQQEKFKHQITYCMSKMSQNNDRYYGGYAASSGLPTEELRVQSSTFANYIAGTIGIVFFMFLVFVLLQIMTFIMMMFAR